MERVILLFKDQNFINPDNITTFHLLTAVQNLKKILIIFFVLIIIFLTFRFVFSGNDKEVLRLSSKVFKEVTDTKEQIQAMKESVDLVAETYNDLKACLWVQHEKGDLPRNAVAAGIDSNDTDLFVARINYTGNVIPGKLQPIYEKAYIGWNGKEIERQSYEVLCNCIPRWKSMKYGEIPRGAFVAGQLKNGTPLYIGRARHAEYLIPGWVQPNVQTCHVSFGSKEHEIRDFKIMVV